MNLSQFASAVARLERGEIPGQAELDAMCAAASQVHELCAILNRVGAGFPAFADMSLRDSLSDDDDEPYEWDLR